MLLIILRLKFAVVLVVAPACRTHATRLRSSITNIVFSSSPINNITSLPSCLVLLSYTHLYPSLEILSQRSSVIQGCTRSVLLPGSQHKALAHRQQPCVSSTHQHSNCTSSSEARCRTMPSYLIDGVMKKSRFRTCSRRGVRIWRGGERLLGVVRRRRRKAGNGL